MSPRRLAGAAALLGLLVVLGAQPAAADTASDLAAAQARAALIKQVRSQLDGNLADALAAQDQLDRSLKDNQKQQADTQDKIDQATAKIARLDAEIARLQAEIDGTKRKIEVERAQMRSLARAIYVQPGSLLLLLAESHSLSDLLTRVSDLASAGSRARALKVSLGSDLAKLDADQSSQTSARAEQAKLRQGLEDDLAKLEDLQAQQEDSKRKLAEKIDQTKTEMDRVDSQSAELAKKVTELLQEQQDEIIAAAMQQVWDQVKVLEQQNPLGPITSSAGHSKQYRFVWPEQDGAQISQPFGPSPYAFEPAYNGFPHFHTGIDLVLPMGSPVLAADDGIVVLVGSGPYGYGNYVVLAHSGGLTTLYGHLATAVVKAGDTVSQGQPVGLEGSTGNSTGPHLHFELRIGNLPVDPSPYLPPGPPSSFKG